MAALPSNAEHIWRTFDRSLPRAQSPCTSALSCGCSSLLALSDEPPEFGGKCENKSVRALKFSGATSPRGFGKGAHQGSTWSRNGNLERPSGRTSNANHCTRGTPRLPSRQPSSSFSTHAGKRREALGSREYYQRFRRITASFHAIAGMGSGLAWDSRIRNVRGR